MANPGYSLRPVAIFLAYRQVIGQPLFVTYALTGAIAPAGLFTYPAGLPFVFMKHYAVSEQLYGIIFALIAAGLRGYFYESTGTIPTGAGA